MRRIVFLVLSLALRVQAAENWFLPYEPDAHTLALLHFDGDGPDEPNAGGKAPAFKLVGDARRCPGQFGGGVLFEGVKATLNAPPHDAFRLRHDQDFTVEMWVRPDTADDGMLFSIGTRFYLRLEPRKRTGAFGYRAASFPIRFYPITDLPLSKGQWQHIALTHHRDRTVNLYVNGVLAATLSHSDEGDFEKGGSTSIGSHDGWTGYFKGAIDEVRISDCVRQYRPLLSERCFLKGEKARVQVEPARIPDVVNSLHLRVLGKPGPPLFERMLTRNAFTDDLFEASSLPQGEHRAEIVFADAKGQPVSRVATTLAYAGDLPGQLQDRLTAAVNACAEAGESMAPERAASARLLAESARARMEQRDFRAAEERASAAERIAEAARNGEAAYRTEVRRAVRRKPAPHQPLASARSHTISQQVGTGPASRDVRITMSWSAGENAAAALPWAERLGANELAASHGDAKAEGYRVWKNAGYRTVLLGNLPIHDAKWIKDHPDHAQFGYWVTSDLEAKAAVAEIPIISPSWSGSMRASVRFDPKTHWRVTDATDDKVLPVADWDYDAETRRVRLRSAVPGHRYRVHFMVEAEGMGDPLFPAFAEHGITALNEELSPFKGVLDTYWFNDLSFAYPGPTPQGTWDWESYTFAARPETHLRFTRDTGIAFDPAWLVMAPRTIDVVPDPRYLAWMSWVQRELKPWLARAAQVCKAHGVSSWLYWGDCHVGMEPYRGSLEGTLREIDKPAADPVTARALVDFPGQTLRRLRVEWLFPSVAASAQSANRLLSQWSKARRGLLMKPAAGIYWMPFPDVAVGRDAGVREDIVETLAEINDEFRFIGDRLAGSPAFTHDINVYVLHAWGSVYAWRPWGSPILTHLTDLPVRVRFLSHEEVERNGLPADAHALFLYGMPNTAWSGGRWWESGKVAAAVRQFVEGGGGLLAMQSPSHMDKPQPHWALGDLLGVRAEGTTGYQPAQTDASQLADTGVTVEERKGEAALLPARSPHWLTEGLQGIAGVQETVRVAALPSAQTLCLLRSGNITSPGVAVCEPGKGRVVYVCGWSSEYAFSRLIRRAVFWAARREADAARLDVSGGDGLFVYAYPNERILALANDSHAPVKAVLRCDPAIFGAKTNLRLADAAANRRLWEGNAAELAAGVPVEAAARCVRLIQVE